MSSSTIFLTLGHISDELKNAITTNDKLTVIDKRSYIETASNSQFNESKYMGTICLLISQGVNVVIQGAETLVTKKGAISVPYHISKRIGEKVSCNYVFIQDENPINDKETKLLNWATTNANVMTVKQFLNLKIKSGPDISSNVRVTCGLLTMHQQNDEVVTGHVTRKFGITVQEANVTHENNAQHIGKIYKGDIIELTVDNKPGGTIIFIDSLGETSHVTNNTIIRSALSGLVLEKYLDGAMEFTLTSIDPNAKQDRRIKVAKIGEVDVNVTGWYTYAIEKPKE